MANKELTMRELNTMDPDAVWSYERSLGFIGKIFDAITHADNIREKTVESCRPTWTATWTFDNAKQRDYFRMIAKARGWFVNDLPRNQFGLRLETRLEPIFDCACPEYVEAGACSHTTGIH